jgi:hypothetical protein
MRRTRPRLSPALAAALLLTCLSTAAVGQEPDRVTKPPGIGAANDRSVQLTGVVLCTNCRLEAVQQGHPQAGKLYELTSSLGPLVLQVDEVKDNGRWERITLDHQLTLQAPPALLQQLAAEPKQEVTLTGLLNSDRTLEVTSVERRKR